MPTRSRITKFIRDAVAIVIEVRVLIAELAVTVATLYALLHRFRLF